MLVTVMLMLIYALTCKVLSRMVIETFDYYHDLKSMGKRTALHYAAQNEGPEIVEALIEAKADLEIPDKDGETPLLCAVKHGHPEVVALLTKRKAQRLERAVMTACDLGRVEALERLLWQGVDLQFVYDHE
eukprot:3412109-Rhodomonas_salina.1